MRRHSIGKIALATIPVLFVQTDSLDTSGGPVVATFSIVGYDPSNGDLGVAVQSKFFAVGAVVPYAKAGVGAIATQAWANTTYGPRGLAMLEKGLKPQEVIERLTGDDEKKNLRQVGIIDAKGHAAAFTGSETIPWAGHKVGESYAAQGNILAGENVILRMANGFETTKGFLGDRLIAALEAGQAAGGDKRGRQSAAMIVVRKNGGYGGLNDRLIDLRVDDHKTPIKELRRLFEMAKKMKGL